MTQPLENSLSTLNGVKNVTSQSRNYSLIFLEYREDTDMDSAMVKASTAVNQPGRHPARHGQHPTADRDQPLI